MKKTCLVLVLCVSAAACRDPPPPAPPMKAPVAPPPAKAAAPAKPSLAPPLSAAQKAALDAVFTTARDLVKKARKLKQDGEVLEKTKGRQAANDTYVQAKELYRKAVDETEEWIEPDLGKVTAAQVKDHLEAYNSERSQWIKEISDMGKVHKDD